MTRRHAFALVELVTCLAMAAALACILLVTARSSRHLAWQAGSLANLHEFAAITSSYGADNADQFWSYSWRVGVPTGSSYADLAGPPGDQSSAAAAQAVDLLRRRGRPDMPVMSTWLPLALYFHLPLADYLGVDPLLRFAVSPGDANRLHWSNDIPGFENGDYLPLQPDPTDPTSKRWPYSSSYKLPLAFGSPDAVTTRSGAIVPGGSTQFFMTIGSPPWNLGGRRVSEVNYPSQKVFVFDSAQWQGVKIPVFAAYSFARVPMSFVDGSARVRIKGQANPGFQPNNPRAPFSMQLPYTPASWDPPILGGVSSSVTMGFFWTRAGILGRDYDGEEFNTSNW